MRFITPESKILSRGGQVKQKSRRLGGLVIKSAEGLRWSYSSIPLPGSTSTDSKVEAKVSEPKISVTESPTPENSDISGGSVIEDGSTIKSGQEDDSWLDLSLREAIALVKESRGLDRHRG